MDYAVYLGGGSTVIYKKGEGIVLNEASKIAFTRAGKDGADIRVAAAGDAAVRMTDRAGGNFFVESVVSGGRITDVAVCKTFLKEIFDKIDKRHGRASALFCIPCSLSPDELDCYRQSAYGAGFSQVEFVPAVIASAVGIGFDADRASAGLSVFIDEGGTDVAAISCGSIIAGGSVAFGGATATEAVKEYLEKKHKIVLSYSAAEAARLECQTLLANDEVSFKIKGHDGESGEVREVWFNGTECYKILTSIYGRIAKAVNLVIEQCTAEIINDIKDNGVYVGGDASLPTGLREYLTAGAGVNIVMCTDGINSAVAGMRVLLNDDALIKKIVKVN